MNKTLEVEWVSFFIIEHSDIDFFAGFMDATSLLNGWLAQSLGDERTAQHVYTRFDSTLYCSNVRGIRDTKPLTWYETVHGNTATRTAQH